MPESFIKRIKNKHWKPFTCEQLPKSALTYLEKEDSLRSKSANWLDAYYAGNSPEEATDWIIVLNDGWYYKVNAQFMIWYTNRKGDIVAQAIWSVSHLKKSLRSILETGEIIRDPGYTT